MVSSETKSPSGRRGKSNRKRPLDETALRDLALSYAARYATTGAKLEAYLARKIRERGIAEGEDGRDRALDVKALVARLIELGYVDDEAYARMRSRDLTARGYGKRRVEQALWAAGVDEQIRTDHAPGEADSRRAAILLAKKRGFGAFGHRIDNAAPADTQRAAKEKQIAAMLRAGHDFGHARFIVEAAAIGDIEDWLVEAQDGETGDRQEDGPW
ncbi:regulatory protein RecX [Erythrobacter sp. JK5]|uniref:regulatory protein RecX n=1 Tax=Erythrobacter sp. JK5 TaxID=2829500 RepID=UPI001BA6F314|nr:regulatory protein RecX [Erythrobacter sp. JK5]QUL36829.1 RecX family transcriptional regulator [Erythrobacter sp. JK5]